MTASDLKRTLAIVGALTGVASCAPVEPTAPTGREQTRPSFSTATSEVTLVNDGFETTPIGAEPYPFIAETWCPTAHIGASTDFSHTGSQSFKYSHACPSGTPSTITTVSFALCTRWPTKARVVAYRWQGPGASHLALHSANESHEPVSGVILGADGVLYVANGGGPTLSLGPYQREVWYKFEFAMDFVAGTFDLYVDDVHQGTFPTAIRRAYWLDFGSGTPGTTFYDDDVTVELELRGERQACDGTEPLPWAWPPDAGKVGT